LKRPAWEVADVLRLTASQLYNTSDLPYVVQKTARDIMHCRTNALGGHKSECSHCDQISISYNSCRNRHCPKCQFSKREQWILDRKADILPVQYFHVVFTLPHTVNQVVKAYPKEVYGILFKAAWKTIKILGDDPKWLGAKLGMIALLHTRGQNLSFHPHLHCIIPHGGWIPEVKRWVYTNHRKFLFPVKVMSKLYRRFFIEFLNQSFSEEVIIWPIKEWTELISSLGSATFNVYTNKPFAGPQPVIDYLGRYSHRVAITNHRIVNLTNNQVTFRYKDYRDDKEKLLKLSPIEFARRFLQHVLPKGFAKIRHFGIFANKSKSIYLSDVLFFFERRKSLKTKFDPLEHIKEKYGVDILLCPVCQKGIMKRFIEIPPARGDPVINMPCRFSDSLALSKSTLF
jgi:hypothetical protein